MKTLIKQKLKSLFPSVVFNEQLNNHSTFRIGGKADAYIEINDLNPKSPISIQAILKFCKQNRIPFFILGGGSNILFHDKGFRGLIIKITAKTVSIKPLKNKKALIIADAGLPLALLVKKALDAGYDNLDSWLGFPGTVGGAVRGNAGAQGLETKDVLVYAEILNPKTGLTRELTPKNLKMKYRESTLKKDNKIVLRAVFELKKQPKTKQKPALSPILFRLQNQPKGYTAGSFFKNPTPKKHKLLTKDQFKAGYLVDQCGLKGLKKGGAQISERHANFFLNANGKATQKDLVFLAAKAKKAVYKKFKIHLEEEVQIVPETLQELQHKPVTPQ
jgi:UDP-N-acetylmuramate dehydrogenase